MKRIFILAFLLAWLTAQFAAAAAVDTLAVRSASMDRDIPVIVILPDGASPANPCPTVYLLHGYGGNQTTWAPDQTVAARHRRPRRNRLRLSRRRDELVPRQQGAGEEPLRDFHDAGTASGRRGTLSRFARPQRTRDHGPQHGRLRRRVAGDQA